VTLRADREELTNKGYGRHRGNPPRSAVGGAVASYPQAWTYFPSFSRLAVRLLSGRSSAFLGRGRAAEHKRQEPHKKARRSTALFCAWLLLPHNPAHSLLPPFPPSISPHVAAFTGFVYPTAFSRSWTALRARPLATFRENLVPSPLQQADSFSRVDGCALTLLAGSERSAKPIYKLSLFPDGFSKPVTLRRKVKNQTILLF
jgi:hypothetical protein